MSLPAQNAGRAGSTAFLSRETACHESLRHGGAPHLLARRQTAPSAPLPLPRPREASEAEPARQHHVPPTGQRGSCAQVPEGRAEAVDHCLCEAQVPAASSRLTPAESRGPQAPRPKIPPLPLPRGPGRPGGGTVARWTLPQNCSCRRPALPVYGANRCVIRNHSAGSRRDGCLCARITPRRTQHQCPAGIGSASLRELSRR